MNFTARSISVTIFSMLRYGAFRQFTRPFNYSCQRAPFRLYYENRKLNLLVCCKTAAALAALLRRRMLPLSVGRESITLLSLKLQNGHFIVSIPKSILAVSQIIITLIYYQQKQNLAYCFRYIDICIRHAIITIAGAPPAVFFFAHKITYVVFKRLAGFSRRLIYGDIKQRCYMCSGGFVLVSMRVQTRKHGAKTSQTRI